MIKAFIRQNYWFLIPYLLFLLGASAFLLTQDKGAMVLLLNDWSTPMLDWFFVFYTHVGDGIFGAVMVLLLLLNNRKKGLMMAVALILTGLVSQALKHSLGAESLRPGQFFKEMMEFREIFSLERHDIHSMPSGHTSSAFCMFMLLSLMSRKRSYGYLLFTLAFLVGVSRIYLAQHFLDDVLAGSFIGVLIAFTTYTLLNEKWSTPALHKPLFAKK